MNTQHAIVPSGGKLGALSGESLLRLVVKLDAVVTGANGVAYLAAGTVLDSLLGVTAGVLWAVGGFLLAFGAAVWLVATRPQISRGAVRALIGANALWAVASVIVVAAGTFSPTTAGSVWIVLQAGAVALFAVAQAVALRRTDG